jgi:ABC-2 type transport system ATP-binding protein
MYGGAAAGRMGEIIDTIGLKERIGDRVKKYSLGMKQRLGLGQALLCDPKVLILDEPTNGLDPMGIIDFRNIVLRISAERRTAVFVSSHILSEIQQMCGRVAIIDGGELLAVEDLDEGSRPKLENRFLELMNGGKSACGA